MSKPETEEYEESIELDFSITFEVTAKDSDEALSKLWDMFLDKTDYIPPTITPVRNEEYEALTGIKAEGTI